ncbi:hypothetical protein PV392_08095 [Streptomyces sp. ME03-5709C]|nr:hypothetical protein [Streptomyces sp. ME03-5709C]
MAVTPWAAGSTITAGRLAAMLPIWGPWTPAWTTSTSAHLPTYGDAVVDCKYAQTGDAVLFEMEITFGATTNFNGGTTSDNWRFSLPVPAAEAQLIAGMGEIQDGTSAERWPVRARLTSTTFMEVELSGRNYNNTAGNSSGLIDAVTPFTWANTDRILLHGHYQAA